MGTVNNVIAGTVVLVIAYFLLNQQQGAKAIAAIATGYTDAVKALQGR